MVSFLSLKMVFKATTVLPFHSKYLIRSFHRDTLKNYQVVSLRFPLGISTKADLTDFYKSSSKNILKGLYFWVFEEIR